jgi:hypothetical protein
MTDQHRDQGTFFAPPERIGKVELSEQAWAVSVNPIVRGLMQSIGGLLAVLNMQRQVLAVNDALLESLGIPNLAKVLGLRPGEAVDCSHARDMAGGCGTSRHCVTCGAAVAIVSCIGENRSVEQKCALQVGLNGQQRDVCFRVKASPLEIGTERVILLFMQDITALERWAALERTFFHDIGNTISSLLTAATVATTAKPNRQQEAALLAQRLAERLARELTLQKALANQDIAETTLTPVAILPDQIVYELMDLAHAHPAGQKKSIRIDGTIPGRRIRTDSAVLIRILTNMVVNAFEATEPEGEIMIRVDDALSAMRFSVWSPAPIPEPLQIRIFQRHFSTKKEPGRGIGTYMMKLFGEEFLGGRVGFLSSDTDGTTFWIELPG